MLSIQDVRESLKLKKKQEYFLDYHQKCVLQNAKLMLMQKSANKVFVRCIVNF